MISHLLLRERQLRGGLAHLDRALVELQVKSGARGCDGVGGARGVALVSRDERLERLARAPPLLGEQAGLVERLRHQPVEIGISMLPSTHIREDLGSSPMV